MTTSKLLVLGSALLISAGLARAQENAPGEISAPAAESSAQSPEAPAQEAVPAEPAAAEEGLAAPAAAPEEDLATQEVPASEPADAQQVAPAEPADAQQMAPAAPADAQQMAPAAPADAQQMAPAAPAEQPAALATGEPPAVPAEAAPPALPADATQPLGMVGYDAQGRPGRLHIVVKGDTLWDISAAYLGTPWVWPSIWQDNREIADPHWIYPGDRIWITPWEMRKVSAEEAAALLAGSPAAPEPEPTPAPEAPPAPVAPKLDVVHEEQPSVIVSDREMVGLVTAEAVDASASIVSAMVKDRVMLGQGDRVWIGLGEDEVEKGDEFTIFRVQEKVYDPETKHLLGYHVKMLGWLDLTEVHPETSAAVIRESVLDIEVGDRLMPRKPPVEEIAVQPSPGEVDGQISFLAEQRTLMGTMEYVYLNRGTLDGLEVGSPLQVYRPGFKAREQVRGGKVEVPDRVIADLLVVKAEPEVSAALIRHTEEELALGDHFRGAGK